MSTIDRPTITTERAQFLADIICTAVEGGTGYFARVLRYKHLNERPEDVHAVLIEDDDETPFKLAAVRATLGHVPTPMEVVAERAGELVTIETIELGIQLLLRGQVSVNRRILADVAVGSATNDAGQIDADAADVIVQAAWFDDIVYG